jgi:predicted MPP superfamily phosphohydrolase
VSRSLSSVLPFFAIAFSLVGLLHFYVWARLVRDPALPPVAHWLLTALMLLLFASVPATLFLARSRGADSLRPLLLTSFGWIGLLFILVMLLSVVDIGKLAAGLVGQLLADQQPVDPDKRATVSRLLGASVALVAGGAGTFAVRSGLNELIVRRVEVALGRLPEALTGTRIAQLTDVHVGPTIRREFIERVVERTNALEPDVIVITGDLVDGSVEQLRDHVAPLAGLKARHGVYFVTGNHEYYSGVDAWCAELERLGIRVLRNERVSIGTDEASFDLAGIDDFNAKGFGRGHGPDLPKALAGRDPTRELVLLAHQPRAIHEANAHGVGLQLSGHTHGGQIFPWNLFVRLQQPVVSGLAKFGNALVYVSNGTGYWGPPMRLGAPAEITEIVLSRAG